MTLSRTETEPEPVKTPMDVMKVATRCSTSQRFLFCFCFYFTFMVQWEFSEQRLQQQSDICYCSLTVIKMNCSIYRDIDFGSYRPAIGVEASNSIVYSSTSFLIIQLAQLTLLNNENWLKVIYFRTESAALLLRNAVTTMDCSLDL